MPSVRGSMSTKTGVKPHCNTDGDIGDPGQRGDDHLAAAVQFLAAPPGSRGWRTTPEFTKTLYFTPTQSRPFLLEGADLLADCVRMGSSWRKIVDDRVQVLPDDVVLHERPIEAAAAADNGFGIHQNGPLKTTLCSPGFSSGIQPGLRPLDQVAGGRGDGAAVGIVEIFQIRRRWAGDRRRSRRGPPGTGSALQAFGHRGDDLGTRAAARSSRYRPPQPAGLGAPTRRSCRCRAGRARSDR